MLKRIKSWLFENRHTRQTVVKNTIWLSIGTIASRVIKAIIIIYAARVMGTESYGIFSYALSLAAMFSLFADIGTGGILTREVSRDPATLEKNLSSSFVIKISLLLFSMFLVGGVAPLFSAIKGADSLMPLAALLIAFDALREFGFSITRAWQKMEIEAGINMVTGIGITIFGLIALWIKPTPFVLMVGYVLGSGLGLLIAAILLGKYLKNFWKNFDWQHTKNMLAIALPFAIGGVLNALTVNTDAVMIGWLRGASDVGLYAAAQRPILLIYMASSLLATSVFPIMMKSIGKDEQRVKLIFEKTMTISFLASMPIFVGGAILAPQIISFIFGSQYTSASATFATLLFTVVMVFAAANLINGIFAYNKQKMLVTYLIIGGVGNVLLDYLLIPSFGILGSAIATIISQGSAYGYLWYQLKKINNFHTLKYLTKGFAAVGIMGLSTFLMGMVHINVIANVAISAIVYFGALILLKEEMVEEVKSIFHLGNAASSSAGV